MAEKVQVEENEFLKEWIELSPEGMDEFSQRIKNANPRNPDLQYAVSMVVNEVKDTQDPSTIEALHEVIKNEFEQADGFGKRVFGPLVKELETSLEAVDVSQKLPNGAVDVITVEVEVDGNGQKTHNPLEQAGKLTGPLNAQILADEGFDQRGRMDFLSMLLHERLDQRLYERFGDPNNDGELGRGGLRGFLHTVLDRVLERAFDNGQPSYSTGSQLAQEVGLDLNIQNLNQPVPSADYDQNAPSYNNSFSPT